MLTSFAPSPTLAIARPFTPLLTSFASYSVLASLVKIVSILTPLLSSLLQTLPPSSLLAHCVRFLLSTRFARKDCLLPPFLSLSSLLPSFPVLFPFPFPSPSPSSSTPFPFPLTLQRPLLLHSLSFPSFYPFYPFYPSP